MLAQWFESPGGCRWWWCCGVVVCGVWMDVQLAYIEAFYTGAETTYRNSAMLSCHHGCAQVYFVTLLNTDTAGR